MKFAKSNVMSRSLLEALIADYQGNGTDQCRYVWHGGEPTLAGIDFYKTVIALQEEHRRPKQVIRNSIQTNGWAIDDVWAKFFLENEFGVGISIDGPQEINDRQRGDGYYKRTMRGLSSLSKIGKDFSTICVVTSSSVAFPDEIWDFFRGAGFRTVSFNPVFGDDLHAVKQNEFSSFLTRIYTRWVQDDDADMSVRFLEEAIITMLGGKTSLCMMQGGCQNHLVIECDGRIMPCHSHAGDDTSIGVIGEVPLKKAASHNLFDPLTALIDQNCMNCRWYALCGGDCIRFIEEDNGLAKSTFCSARKEIFAHIEDDLITRGYLTAKFEGSGSRSKARNR
jgi:uncharacterized protein